MTRPLTDLLLDMEHTARLWDLAAANVAASGEDGLGNAMAKRTAALLRECRDALTYAQGERERTVKWLREQAIFNRGEQCFESAFACDSAANAIERGAHDPKE